MALESGHRESSSTETTTPDTPLVVQRLELLVNNMMRLAGKDNKYARHMWVMKAIFDEVVDEMVDRDLAELEQWLAATGMVVKWIGTGELSDLPPDFQSIVPQHLLEMSRQPIALPAGAVESTAPSD